MRIGNEKLSISKEIIHEGDERKRFCLLTRKKLKDITIGEIAGQSDKRFIPCNEGICGDECPFCEDGDCALMAIQEAVSKIGLDSEIVIVKPLWKSEKAKRLLTKRKGQNQWMGRNAK